MITYGYFSRLEPHIAFLQPEFRIFLAYTITHKALYSIHLRTFLCKKCIFPKNYLNPNNPLQLQSKIRMIAFVELVFCIF